MYSEQSISYLVNRIGFGKPTNSLNVIISDANQIGTSGRTFSYFHKLVTLENLYNTVSTVNMLTDDFNEYLTQLKYDSVKAVLSEILNKNILYRDDFDYSDTIISRPELFEDAIGYSVAISAIEQFISTTRINADERNAKFAYNMLKMDIEGLTDEDGRLRAKGLKYHLLHAIKQTGAVLFPVKLVIDKANVW